MSITLPPPPLAAASTFNTPTALNSSTAVNTTGAGRPVASESSSKDDDDDDDDDDARMCASTHAAGIEILRGGASSRRGHVTSAQPKDGMQTRGQPANMRGVMEDCWGSVAVSAQSGMITWHVPVGGRREGCSAASI